MEWEEFLERLEVQLHEVYAMRKPVTVTILLWRRNKKTGEALPLSPEDVKVHYHRM